jgi:hypothetical protein
MKPSIVYFEMPIDGKLSLYQNSFKTSKQNKGPIKYGGSTVSSASSLFSNNQSLMRTPHLILARFNGLKDTQNSAPANQDV